MGVHPRVGVTTDQDIGVGIVTFGEPPNNYLNTPLLAAIIDALSDLDGREDCRALILRSTGKHFCAGRDHKAPRTPEDTSELLYAQAARLLRLAKPWVALIQGGAIGSGLGIAALADFRVVASTGYFHANFVKLGLHPGFGLSLTLPAIIGDRQAMRMLYFGDRVPAAAAGATGLADVVLGEQEDLLVTGSQFAAQLASRPAAALQAIRRTCRRGLTESDFHAAVAHEHEEQSRLRLPA